MPEAKLIKLRLSLMGKPLRMYTFDKPVITVGRDPSSDIALENPGVSRDHLKLERLADGTYRVVDLGSANGTQVNDKPVNVAALDTNDVVRFGKYTMWVSYDEDRRQSDEGRSSATGSPQATFVLSRNEINSLIEAQKEKDKDAPSPTSFMPAAQSTERAAAGRRTLVISVVLAFLVGAASGAAATWLALPH